MSNKQNSAKVLPTTKIIIPNHLKELIEEERKIELQNYDKSSKVNKSYQKKLMDDFLDSLNIKDK